MAYLDEVAKLKPNDPKAALELAKKAVKAGELNRKNAEALLMMQFTEENRKLVNKGLLKLFEKKKK